jgi:hypothetical protein
MSTQKRDKRKVDPTSGAEDKEPAKPLETVPPGKPANATNAVIPGTGEVIENVRGKEAKRVTRT